MCCRVIPITGRRNWAICSPAPICRGLPLTPGVPEARSLSLKGVHSAGSKLGLWPKPLLSRHLLTSAFLPGTLGHHPPLPPSLTPSPPLGVLLVDLLQLSPVPSFHPQSSTSGLCIQSCQHELYKPLLLHLPHGTCTTVSQCYLLPSWHLVCIDHELRRLGPSNPPWALSVCSVDVA